MARTRGTSEASARKAAWDTAARARGAGGEDEGRVGRCHASPAASYLHKSAEIFVFTVHTAATYETTVAAAAAPLPVSVIALSKDELKDGEEKSDFSSSFSCLFYCVQIIDRILSFRMMTQVYKHFPAMGFSSALLRLNEEM